MMYPLILLVVMLQRKQSVKALSSNYEKKLIYNEIEIINNSSGVPEVVILKPELNNLKIKISISHTEDNAIAMAIIIH